MTPEEDYYSFMQKKVGDFMIKSIINPMLVKNGIDPKEADVKVEWITRPKVDLRILHG